MRRGEVLGIRWEDIDLDDKRLSVRQAVLNVAYEVVDRRREDDRSSRRTVDLDPRTVAVLKQWKRDQLEQRDALGVRPKDDSLVFAKPDGTPIHPDSYSQYFDRLVAAPRTSRGSVRTTCGTPTPRSCSRPACRRRS